MTERDNYLHTVRFGDPCYIPAKIYMNLSSLIAYKSEMESVIVKYPEFFGEFTLGKIDYSIYGDGTCDIKEKDVWGYTWHYAVHGIEGCVSEHPRTDSRSWKFSNTCPKVIRHYLFKSHFVLPYGI
jgi:hypothetical protein